MRILEIEKELFDRAATRLEMEHLITTKGLTIDWSSGNYSKEYFDTGMQRAINDASNIITQLGQEFVKSIIKND